MTATARKICQLRPGARRTGQDNIAATLGEEILSGARKPGERMPSDADMLKMFDAVFTMTRGGPGTATEFISIYIQRVAFRLFDQGMASAQAVLLLILTIVLSRLYIRFVYREAV